MKKHITKSSTNPSPCDLCGCINLKPVHNPLNSRYKVIVNMCEECNLVQSRKTVMPNHKVRTTSSDADWGNIRHGKSLRLDVIKTMFNLEDFVHGKVLDIGSNRGDFANWSIGLPNVTNVVCVETDKTILDDYSSDLEVRNNRIEDVDFQINEKFDFIYSCQTLEHADSALEMLQISHNLMAPDATMLIDIPHIKVIIKPDVIEEFFIDKHKFHFSENVIKMYFEKVGLTCIGKVGDDYNLTYLLKKTIPKPLTIFSNHLYGSSEFKEYRRQLLNNRKKLIKVVQQRIEPLLIRQSVAFWGAGRPLDALIKFGGLKLEETAVIVDSYIAGKIKINNVIEIQKPSVLKLVEPNVVFILANSAEDKLSEKAYRMGIRHVIKLSEMMQQVDG